MRIVDTHAHLEELPDIENAIGEARAAGVVKIIGVGTERRSNQRALELSKQCSDIVVPAIGLHPWNLADDIGSELEFIKSNIDKCVAVGEVGLDYWIERDRNLQRRALREVLQLAAEYNKPVILHSRGAWEDAFELVKAAALERVVFHWYSGPLDILRQILDHGYCISATPAAEYSRSHRRAIATAPLERIVLETDSPVNYRGLEARPVHVLRTLDAVAELKDVPAPEVAEITTRTAFALFRL